MTATAIVVRDPQRLAALCDLWQSGEREVTIKLQGVSMCPTILPGTRLLLRCHKREMPLGTIIAYRLNGLLIVHRLAEISDGSEPGQRLIICRGDNTLTFDPPVPLDAVVGEVIQIGPPPVLAWARWNVRKAGRFCKRVLRKDKKAVSSGR